jgi:hypothetical protein
MPPGQIITECPVSMALYFDAGAKEVWVCGSFGQVSFFGPGGVALSNPFSVDHFRAK